MPRSLAPGVLRGLLHAAATPALAGLLLGGVGCLVELGVRTTALRVHLPPPSLGTGLPYFETELSRLDDLVRREGFPQCLFLGSSAASSAIDPERFGEAYRTETGNPVRCFNAGLPGLPVSAAGTLADLLADLYRPRLVVFGVIARDFTSEATEQFGRALEDVPWVRYELGAPSLEGWLLAHSQAYRVYLGYREAHDPVHQQIVKQQERWPEMSPLGFLAERANGDGLINPATQPGLLPVLAGRGVAPDAMSGLARLFALRHRGTDVILVVIPTHPSSLTLVEGGQDDYDALVGRVATEAAQRQIAFWETASLHVVPDDGWADMVHMNVKGAAVFSAWLGRRVGEAVRRGDIVDPTA